MEETPTKLVSLSVLDRPIFLVYRPSSSNSKETSLQLQQPPSTSACSSASVSEHDTVSTTRFSSRPTSTTAITSRSSTRSSFRVCCVCGRELMTFRKYTKPTKELAQKISVLAGQAKSIDLSASARICIPCKRKVEKAAETATIVKHAFHWQHEENQYQAVSASVSAPIAVSRVQYEANTGNISISSGKSSTPSVRKRRMSKTCESPVVSLERTAKTQKITAAASTREKLNFSTGTFSSAVSLSDYLTK